MITLVKWTYVMVGMPICGLVAVLSVQAQLIDTSTNAVPLEQTVKFQRTLEQDLSQGERAILAPGVEDRLSLTVAQQVAFLPIKADFVKTCQDYQAANQPRIDAALEAIRRANLAKSDSMLQTARHQLQQVWAGLQKYRDASVRELRLLLDLDQIKVLDDPSNQWRENHNTEANDPSSR